MARFCISPAVFERLPDACFGAVVAHGVNNRAEKPEITSLMRQETENLRRRMEGANLKEHPDILPYREAFLALGINPNKFMCSVEALCKRVLKGSDLPVINPIVDIGNAMSLKYCLPMGAHDIGKLAGGDLEVRPAGPEDRFTPFGETAQETPDDGELIYVCGHTVKTRRWIWRQSEDGKIDEGSCDVVFPIDGFLGKNEEAVRGAQRELAALLEELFGCAVSTGFLTADNLAVEF